MKTVWRYKLTTQPLQMIEMPSGAEPVSVAGMSLYAIVDPKNAIVAQPIIVVRPGEPLPPAAEMRVVGTIAGLSHSLVIMHVSEVSMADLEAFKKATLESRAAAVAKAAKAKQALKSAPELAEDEDEEDDDEDE